MCGRFALTATPDEVRRLFAYVDQPNFPPREDIRPTQPIGVVVVREGVRRFMLVRWGFIPSWAPDPGTFTLLINARAETATTKPSFRAAMRHGRCLIPATGFTEWQRRETGPKQPFHIAPREGGLVAFAGLMETWAGADGSEIDTAAILTVAANGTIAPIHDRMPAVIPARAFDLWLDTGRVDAKEASRLLVPAPDDLFGVEALAMPAKPPRPVVASRTRAAAAGGRHDDDGQMDLFRGGG